MPPFTWSIGAPSAVSIKTGMALMSSSSSDLRRCSTVHPSTPGIITSSTTRSGRSSCTAVSASAPSLAVTVSWPSRSSVISIRNRMSGSSSTTRIFAMRSDRGADRALPHALDPCPRIADLGQRRQLLRAFERAVEQRRPADGLDGLDEPLSLRVLVHLRLEPDDALQDARCRVEVAPALAQHPAEAVRARHPAGAGPVHRHVAVTLEQAHEPA